MEWLNKLVGINLIFLTMSSTLKAQEQTTIVVNESDTLRPSKYIPLVTEEPKLQFFQGFTLSADLFGILLKAMSDYGSVEAALRLNLKNTYFPIVEAGYGECSSTNDDTNIHYSTKAPFFRVGIDFNLLRDKFQDNRLFVGARYAFSSFQFDMSGPSITDPIWGGTAPFSYHNANSNSSWMEIVFGVQVKIWRNIHMGWSARYKQELKIGQPQYAKPYYIPGYGTTTNTSCWGGTYNLIFDLNWGKRSRPTTATQ